jgi:hypothetical protein
MEFEQRAIIKHRVLKEPYVLGSLIKRDDIKVAWHLLNSDRTLHRGLRPTGIFLSNGRTYFSLHLEVGRSESQ